MQEAHVVRTSERRSFRGCRRRWNWAYREGYRPVEVQRPLEFGIAFHVAMQVIYDPESWFTTGPEEKLAKAKAAFAVTCEGQRDRYLLAMSMPRLDKNGQDDYDQRIRLGYGMLDHYICSIHSENDGWFKPVKVEVPFEVPLLDSSGSPIRCFNSPTCGQLHENGVVVLHGGRVDAIIEDLEHGGYYIIDWKTATSLIADPYLLWMDDQICAYCWALRFVLNIDIRGFLYVEIRKDYPRRPDKLERKRNGGVFSQNKNMATSLDVYRRTVQELDADAYAAGAYDGFLEFLASKDAPKFHQRFKIEKSDKELELIGGRLAEEVQDMLDPKLRVYPSTGRFSCPSCAYKSPCEMEMRGADYLFTLDTLFHRTKVGE